MDPLIPMAGTVGGIGRTPIPVAESTHHPGERPLTSVGKSKGQRPEQRGEFQTLTPDQEGNTEEVQGGHQGGESEWALPEPSDPCRPPRGERERRRYLFRVLRGEMKAPPGRNTLPLINN